MQLRIRSLTALLALSGLLALSAEGAAAATCAASMAEQSAEAGWSSTSAADGACRMTTDGQVPDNGSDGPRCPQMPMSGGSCGTAAAVPAEGALQLTASIAEGRVAPPDVDSTPRIFAELLFRPPIA